MRYPNLILAAVIAASVLLWSQTHETLGTPTEGGSGSARVLITTATASNSASIDFDTVFDSTYDWYEIEIVGAVPVTDDTEMYAQFRSGGSYQAANYDTQIEVQSSGTASSQEDVTADNTFMYIAGESTAVFGLGNRTESGADVRIRVYQPSSTSRYTMLRCVGVYANAPASAADTRAMWNDCWAIWQNAAAVTGIKFYMSSGNISSGQFRVWGIPKS